MQASFGGNTKWKLIRNLWNLYFGIIPVISFKAGSIVKINIIGEFQSFWLELFARCPVSNVHREDAAKNRPPLGMVTSFVQAWTPPIMILVS